MRKMMTKEVTTTAIHLAKIEMVDGEPKAVPLPVKEVLGNVSIEKAQKLVTKELGQGVSVVEVYPETKIYQMEVENFIELATIKEEK